MFVNFINPRYPGEDTAAGTCHFRLLKNSPDVCQIRVDFVDTVTIIKRFKLKLLTNMYQNRSCTYSKKPFSSSLTKLGIHLLGFVEI